MEIMDLRQDNVILEKDLELCKIQINDNNADLVKAKDKDKVIEKLVDEKKESMKFVDRRLSETKKELEITDVNIKKVLFICGKIVISCGRNSKRKMT